jgi:hypothetical protein
MDQGMRIWNERGHLERNWQVDTASGPGAPDYPYGERGQSHRNRRISGGRF